jgi:hypothetical protein
MLIVSGVAKRRFVIIDLILPRKPFVGSCIMGAVGRGVLTALPA